MNNLFRSALVAAAVAVPTLTCLSSCDENDVAAALDAVNGVGDIITGASCSSVPGQLAEAIKNEGTILDQTTFIKQLNEPNYAGDFAMALTLNADAINKLFQKAASWNYDLNIGLASIKLQLPTIAVGGCTPASSDYTYSGSTDNCLSFTIPLEGSVLGLGSFSLKAKFGVPVIAVQKQNDDGSNLRSSIFANLPEAQFLGFSANGNSVPQPILQIITPIVKSQLDLKRAHLFDIAAWELGENQIKLLAGSPRVNLAAGTLTFGMYSNLQYAIHSNAQWAYEMNDFPSDAEVGLHIAPDLIRGILARMLYEQQIDTAIAIQNGSTDTTFTVTIPDMATEYDEAYLLAKDPDFYNYFTMAFRLWSSENVCGYMDFLAGLKIEVSEAKFSIGLGSIFAGKATGGMSVFAVGGSILTQTDFFKGILEYTNYSVNFNEITVPDGDNMTKARMGSQHINFKVNGTGMSLYLNFLDF